MVFIKLIKLGLLKEIDIDYNIIKSHETIYSLGSDNKLKRDETSDEDNTDNELVTELKE
jgi:hypothetical protein